METGISKANTCCWQSSKPFEMSNARYEATNRVDHLEMEEVTFERSSCLCCGAVTSERHRRLPSRWHYAINNSTLKNPGSKALSKKINF